MLVRQSSIAIFVAIVLVITYGQEARADGPYSTGGASKDPRGQVLSPEEQRVLGQKAAAFERTKRERERPTDVVALWAVGAETDIYEEPQYDPWGAESANWCGPGSTTAVVSNWNAGLVQNFSNQTYGNGGQGYLTWLAKEGAPGIGPMVVTDPNTGKPITYDTTLRSTVNNQIGQPFYYIVGDINHTCGVCGLSNFESYLYTDLGTYGRPLFTVVWTAGMEGWGSWGVAHYQWIVYASTDFDNIDYGDSAGDNSNPNGVPFGFHSVSLSWYYNQHVRDIHVWDEIVW